MLCDSAPLQILRTVEKIVRDVLRLKYSLTIDVNVNPVVQLAGSDSDTGRVPDCHPPGRVEVVFTREIQVSQYLALTPLLALTLHLISVVLSAAVVEMVTWSANVAAQQGVPPNSNQSLEWKTIWLGREVVSEEPGTDSDGGVFPQGGVQHLSLAVFCWQ